MKSLEEQMSIYAAYHQDGRNKATHFVGVPVIILALMIPLAWVRIDLGTTSLSAAMAIATVLLAYYLALDFVLGLAMVVVMGVLLWLGQLIANQGAVAGWTWFGVLFVGGWILQLVGHVFEGRRPALADNLFQIFVAPIFLCAEAFFALGYKPKLHSAVMERARRSLTTN
ncbi:MAG: Mpo1 family 2-hydroxy fatty acid dioxygenase [Betaproteobacteria bacterium]